MRIDMIVAIYRKEILDLTRDRRTVISMVLLPVLLIPLLLSVSTKLITNVQRNATQEARTMPVALHAVSPAIREALQQTGIALTDAGDVKDAVLNKTAAAGVEESGAVVRVVVDGSNPTSSAAGERVRVALDALKDAKIREALAGSGISPGILTPFTVRRDNVAGARKMAGMMWGSMLGYLLLLMMFSGGMHPVIDMTVGEKERKTMEALLASPAHRKEIVIGKGLAAMTAIFTTAILMLGSLVYTLKGGAMGADSPEMKEMLGTIPLDPHTVLMIAVTLLPLAIFAASIMIAISLFAKSAKEAGSYLTPLLMVVIFPALMGGLAGIKVTPMLCLIPIFNASQMIRSILLGDATTTNFAITTVANLVYAALAFWIATKTFENENVLFRS